MWCFLLVHNSQDYSLEGLSAVFHLAGQQSQPALAPQILSQAAFLPLDRLAPGSRLPLVAHFPSEQVAALTPPYQADFNLLTALPGAEDGRYLPMHVENKQIILEKNKRSANLLADIIPDSAGNARRVWAAAIAYDAHGNVVGVRRWERQDAQPLESGQALSISFSVYSVSAEIEQVDLYIEARP